jgi:hypothetical protein
MQDRIVITGMGTVNPLGLNVEESWKNAIAGVSGVAPITLFDSTPLNVHIAAEVKNFNPDEYMDPKEVRRRDRYEQLAVVAASQAIRQAGLEVPAQNAGRIGVIVSSAIGGLKSLQDAVITNHEEGPRRVSPFLIPMLMSNGGAGMIAIDHGIKVPCFSVASACASGADGIGVALMMLQTGMIDVALAGSAETTITSTGVAAFDRIGATTRRNDAYHMVPQPFDRNRDGHATEWLASPGSNSIRRYVFDVFVNGTHPLLPWFAFLCAGIVLGRMLTLSWWRSAAAGTGLALVAGAWSATAIATTGLPGVATSTDPVDRSIGYVASALGTALLAYAAIDWLAERFPTATDPLRRAGQLSLSLYLAHILVFILTVDWLGWIEPAGTETALLFAGGFWVGAIVVATRWQRRFGRGPAEYVYRAFGG